MIRPSEPKTGVVKFSSVNAHPNSRDGPMLDRLLSNHQRQYAQRRVPTTVRCRRVELMESFHDLKFASQARKVDGLRREIGEGVGKPKGAFDRTLCRLEP